MKFKELAQLGSQERKAKQSELELELIKLNTQVATGTPPKNAGMVSRIKKDIARLMLISTLSAKKDGGKAVSSANRSTPAKTEKKVAKK